MKIVLLSWRTVRVGFGGLEGHLFFLERELRQRGHQVTTIVLTEALESDSSAPRPHGGLAALAARAGSARTGDMAARLLDRLRDGARLRSLHLGQRPEIVDADIIHFHDFLRIVPLARDLSVLGKPLIWTNHLGEFLRIRRLPLGTLFLRYLTRPFDQAIGPSAELADAATICPPVVYIPNGVDPGRFPLTLAPDKPARRRELGIEASALVLVPRRWAPTKGVLEAAAAARKLRGTGIQFAFLGADGTRDYPRYGELIRRELEGLPNVIVRPSVSYAEMPQWVQAADILLVPSRLEATSLSALEGMSSGAVVVASAVGGLTQIVRPGNNGFLLKKADAVEIATSVKELLGMGGKDLDSLRIEAARLVRNEYTWETVAKRVEDVYLSALASKKAQAG